MLAPVNVRIRWNMTAANGEEHRVYDRSYILYCNMHVNTIHVLLLWNIPSTSIKIIIISFLFSLAPMEIFVSDDEGRHVPRRRNDTTTNADRLHTWGAIWNILCIIYYYIKDIIFHYIRAFIEHFWNLFFPYYTLKYAHTFFFALLSTMGRTMKYLRYDCNLYRIEEQNTTSKGSRRSIVDFSNEGKNQIRRLHD